MGRQIPNSRNADDSLRLSEKIVDDDEEVPGVRPAFSLREHEVRMVSNADEGLHEVSTFQPDAVLLDLLMPLVNRFGFLYPTRRFARSSRTSGTRSTGISIAVCVVDSYAASSSATASSSDCLS